MYYYYNYTVSIILLFILSIEIINNLLHILYDCVLGIIMRFDEYHEIDSLLIDHCIYWRYVSHLDG